MKKMTAKDYRKRSSVQPVVKTDKMEMKQVPEELTIAELIEKEEAEYKQFFEEQQKKILGIRKLIVDEGESLELESLISSLEDDLRTEELERAKEVKFSHLKFKDNDLTSIVYQNLNMMTLVQNIEEELKKDEHALNAISKTNAIEASEYALKKKVLESKLQHETDAIRTTRILRSHHESASGQEKQSLFRTIFEFMVEHPDIDYFDINPNLIFDNVNERMMTLEYLVNKSLEEFEDNPELLRKWEQSVSWLSKAEQQRLEAEKLEKMRKRCDERTTRQAQVRKGRILRRRYLPVEDTLYSTVEEPETCKPIWDFSIVNPANEEKYQAVVNRLREENIGNFLSKTAAVGQNLPKGKGVSAGQECGGQPTRLPPIAPLKTRARQQCGGQPTRLPPISSQKTSAGQQLGVRPTRLPPISSQTTPAGQQLGVRPTRLPPISHQKTPAEQQLGVKPTRLPPIAPLKTRARQQCGGQPTRLPPISSQTTPAGQQLGVKPTRLPPIAPLKTRARQQCGGQPTRLPPISSQKTPAGQQWAWQPTPLPPDHIKKLISRYSDS